MTEAQSVRFVLRELELGDLAPDEVLVEVAAVGICHPDLMVRDRWLSTPEWMPLAIQEAAGQAASGE